MAVRVGPATKRFKGRFKRTFVFVAKFPGNKSTSARYMGEYGSDPESSTTLEEARDIAGKWRKLLKRGDDPVALENEARRKDDEAVKQRELSEQRRQGDTFGKVAEAYVASSTA